MLFEHPEIVSGSFAGANAVSLHGLPEEVTTLRPLLHHQGNPDQLDRSSPTAVVMAATPEMAPPPSFPAAQQVQHPDPPHYLLGKCHICPQITPTAAGSYSGWGQEGEWLGEEIQGST